jgi:hypothetical protein
MLVLKVCSQPHLTIVMLRDNKVYVNGDTSEMSILRQSLSNITVRLMEETASYIQIS